MSLSATRTIQREAAKQRERRLSRRAVAVLGGVALATAACGSSASSAPKPKPSSATPSAHVVKLSFWYGLGGTLGKDVQSFVHAFDVSHPDIQVTASYGGSYSGGGPEQQKILASLAAGNPPDLAQLEVHSLPVFAGPGDLRPVTKLMTGASASSTFLPGILKSTMYHGQYYGVPWNRSVPVLYYNKTLLTKAGIAAPPTTWTQLAQDAKMITSGSGKSKVYGFDPIANWWWWEPAVESGGGTILSKDLKKATFDSPSALAILKIQQKLVKEGDAKVATGSDNIGETATAFNDGRVAMMVNTVANLASTEKGVGTKFKWGIAIYPHMPGHSTRTPPGGANIVMFKHMPSADVSAAWTFIEWMTKPTETAKWSEVTGYVPVKTAALSSPSFVKFEAAHPQEKVAVDAVKNTFTPPPSPHYLGVLTYVNDAMTSAFESGAPISKTIAHAASQSDKLLGGS